MSDSVRPHRRQPTRLPRPWDSPGKNTGVGCHFLLQCIKVKVKSLSHVRLLVTPWTAAHQAPPSMGFSRQEYWSGVPLPSPFTWLPLTYSLRLFCIFSRKPFLGSVSLIILTELCVFSLYLYDTLFISFCCCTYFMFSVLVWFSCKILIPWCSWLPYIFSCKHRLG